MANPEITNNDISSLVLRDGEFRDITLNAPGAVIYPKGQVLAFDAAADKWKKTISGTPAVANAKGVLSEEVEFTGAGDKTNVRMIKGGTLDQNLLVFDGSDTVDTIPSGADDSFQLQLRAYNIVLENPAEQRIQDNQ
jgi:hypothetical protein